ncbi:hypothetical protein [Bartonella sp. CB74]|uniref:hypothetical protein n=1 Tax=Bartonella sp. CB74 TaxID=3113620 RepID=UPI002F96DFCE
MPSYLKTVYQGIPLYYAGRIQNTVKLEPKKYNALPFISQKAAEYVAKNLAEQYLRDDFSIVQQND